MSTSRILKWTTGAFEAVLGVPLLGAAIIIGFLWIPLAIMLVLHIVTLLLTIKDGGSPTGSILGIVTSCIAWIPFVGITMHIITAIFLMINAAKPDRTTLENKQYYS
ncbi:hypothetical protein [[Bacillus] enclensis]|uniref:hypothetical protein n=1 Tax=[Bacillus] enclensis TaxID=1402860 RepID=UPI0018DB9E6E|nr:hypothetical protein [[Bacillus] enclensis]